jgi:hypothetical protein
MMAEAQGRAMRRDRPAPPEQLGSARGPGFSGSPKLGFALRDAFRLTRDRRRSRVPGGSRAYLGNVGQQRPDQLLEQVLLNKCATDFSFRDAKPDDNCNYPSPSPDGRLYYRFKRGPLGQAADEPHPVEGVLLKQRQIIMKTDSVVAEALLGAEDALD